MVSLRAKNGILLKAFVFFVPLWCMLVLGAPGVAVADGSHPDKMLAAAKFDQKLNAPVPGDLHFRDETGRDVALASYFGNRPVILVMAYFNCPNLCPLVIDNMVANLGKLTFDAGNQFDVVAVSIDPRETPAVAASKKQH